MKFNRVDENRLQILLNKEDLSKRDMLKWDFFSQNAASQHIFQELMEEAYKECGFEVDNNTQLMIEALPISTESILITVTKVADDIRSELEQEFLNFSQKFLQNIEEEDVECVDDVVYAFDDLEEVIQLAKAMENFAFVQSQLYRLNGKYYLHLPEIPPQDSVIYGYLDEYGSEIELACNFLLEHAEVVITEAALSKLARL